MSFLARRRSGSSAEDRTSSAAIGDRPSSIGDRPSSNVDRPAAIGNRRSILAATILALVAAALILVTVVLPAEYGIDLLGTGRLLGLTELSAGATGAISPQPAEYKVDTTEFVLGAYEFVEYKYRIEQGGAMVFSWEATRPVMYDFHSEPEGAPEGYAESFDKAETAQAHGTYTAPFSGIHGWFWENPGPGDVTIKLTTAGFYSAAQEYRDNDIISRKLSNRQKP